MTVKDIKKEFFTYRNGSVADVLRKAGMPYKMIFGLNIPQLAAIARMAAASGEDEADALARQLWGDAEVRESRLLAAYLFDAGRMSHDDAMAIATTILTREEADMLAFRLFRRLEFAPQLVSSLAAHGTPLCSYAAEVLARHLGGSDTL